MNILNSFKNTSSVDAIIKGFNETVSQLFTLAEKKNAEAIALEKTIVTLQKDQQDAQAESERATQIAQKITNLLN